MHLFVYSPHGSPLPPSIVSNNGPDQFTAKTATPENVSAAAANVHSALQKAVDACKKVPKGHIGHADIIVSLSIILKVAYIPHLPAPFTLIDV